VTSAQGHARRPLHALLRAPPHATRAGIGTRAPQTLCVCAAVLRTTRPGEAGSPGQGRSPGKDGGRKVKASAVTSRGGGGHNDDTRDGEVVAWETVAGFGRAVQCRAACEAERHWHRAKMSKRNVSGWIWLFFQSRAVLNLRGIFPYRGWLRSGLSNQTT
jgi:hypothetical protein